jgi:hypothetical protein
MVLIVGLTALAAPASASAAVTIGSDLAASPNGGGVCSAMPPPGTTCTRIQTALPGRQVTAPFDGVIVRWRLKQFFDGDYGPMRLKVASQQSGTSFTGVRSSATENPPDVTGGVGATHLFGTQLPIAAGEFIGIDLLDNCCIEVLDLPDSGAASVFWPPPALGDGETRSGVSVPDTELLFNANLEPDADCDQLGDESQDASIDPQGCSPGPEKVSRNLTLDANKNKVKKRKRVTLTGQLNQVRQGACESSQPVQLQRKKPSQTTFTTVEQLQTNAAGGFSAKRKVKKTFEYRAQVAETDACLGQTSNTEKVKVKRPK